MAVLVGQLLVPAELLDHVGGQGGHLPRDGGKLCHFLCPHILMEVTANGSTEAGPAVPPSTEQRMCNQRSSLRWRPQMTHWPQMTFTSLVTLDTSLLAPMPLFPVATEVIIPASA